MKNSWWTLTIKDYPNFNPNDDTLRHIGEMIAQGYTSGQLLQEDEIEEDDKESEETNDNTR
tara:strand:+ start:341 stop:523 length:183 start_codon:yes stop_codon:yes gene_type:complete